MQIWDYLLLFSTPALGILDLLLFHWQHHKDLNVFLFSYTPHSIQMFPKSGIIYFYLFPQLENTRISFLQEALATEMNIVVMHALMEASLETGRMLHFYCTHHF